MLLPLLAASAFAVPEMHCSGLSLVDTVPSAEATGVPVDTRVALVFGEGGCVTASGWNAVLATADGVEIGWLPGSDPDEEWLLTLARDEPLAPDTAYVVTVTAEDEEAIVFGFTTGTGTVAGITGEPTFEVTDTRWQAESDRSFDGLVSLDLAITPAADPDGLSVIQVRAPDFMHPDPRSYRVPADGPMAITANWMSGPTIDEMCVQVRQIDGLGVATDWSEPVCAAVDTGPAAICGTTSGASLGALVLAGLAGLIRRGRR